LECERRGDGGVDCIAAALEDLNSDVGGIGGDGDDDAVTAFNVPL
jgi:hypothetical protein